MESRRWKLELAKWETENLDGIGLYVGRNLVAFGFPYLRGAYVPVDKRYSTMLTHRWACAAVRMAGVPTRKKEG